MQNKHLSLSIFVWEFCSLCHLPPFLHTLKWSINKTSFFFLPKPFMGHKISHKFLHSTSFFLFCLSVSHFPYEAFTPSDSSFPSEFSPSRVLTPFSFYSSILDSPLINTHTVSVSLENRGLCVWVDRRGVQWFGTNCWPFQGPKLCERSTALLSPWGLSCLWCFSEAQVWGTGIQTCLSKPQTLLRWWNFQVAAKSGFDESRKLIFLHSCLPLRMSLQGEDIWSVFSD